MNFVILAITILLWIILRTKQSRKRVFIIWKIARRDLSKVWMLIKIFYNIITNKRKNLTLPRIFTKVAKRYHNKVAIKFEDQNWTFKELEDFSNKVANYFISRGYKKGDVISLLLENRPEFVGLCLGLSKVGIIPALINTNIVFASLSHCIAAANSKALIYGTDYTENVNAILSQLDGIELFHLCTSSSKVEIKNSINFIPCITDKSTESPTKFIDEILMTDVFLYVYTSGTTGLPKAAKITYNRYNFPNIGFHYFLDVKEDDILYSALPLYHASAILIILAQCLNHGNTIVLRKKFSASNFWSDCIKYKCTIANYIGETCRYILHAHKGKTKIKHTIRAMVGNGMKKEIWKEFVKTFDIPKVYEFYASTEGNTNIINLDGPVGSVGFIPFYILSLKMMHIIKCDNDTKEPLRDANNYCIPCEPNEPGLLIGKISKKIDINKFEGYLDAKETNKKILTHVFKNDDAYFNSGDIMVMDELHNVYFVDRTGDTFRWKGENVATTEIESIVSGIIGLYDQVVYGVEVPKNDGRAGMIAIADKERTLNTKTLAEGLNAALPKYAVPIFLRIMDSLPLTGTYKVKKVELQREGFDINILKDPLYIFDNRKVDYVPIYNIYNDILSGKHKF